MRYDSPVAAMHRLSQLSPCLGFASFVQPVSPALCRRGIGNSLLNDFCRRPVQCPAVENSQKNYNYKQAKRPEEELCGECGADRVLQKMSEQSLGEPHQPFLQDYLRVLTSNPPEFPAIHNRLQLRLHGRVDAALEVVEPVQPSLQISGECLEQRPARRRVP